MHATTDAGREVHRRQGGAVARILVPFAISVVAAACAGDPNSASGVERSLAEVISEIEAGRGTTPLVAQPAPGSEAAVNFLVQSADGVTPRIVSDVTGWGENVGDESFDLSVGSMRRVGSTDWYRLEALVAPGSRIEYLVVHGETDYRTDPNNPRRAWTRGGGPISEFVTPDYVPPPELEGPPSMLAGRTVEAIIDSAALGAPRRVLVYLPPAYHDDGAYPVAVFHAGWGVANEGEAPRVLDWLIEHHEIEPIVAMFLESYLPGDPDNHEGAPLRAFLTQEGPGWLASRYGVSNRADEWAVIAISYGAKDALDAALAANETFGRLGLMIPGRRLTHADLEAFARQRDRQLVVAILAGRYDAANLATARDARRTLTDAGHEVDYIEVPEGHNPTTWRNHLRDVFISLFSH